MTITVKKVIAVVLALSSLLALCSCSAGREKIDLEDFITIEFAKYNGYGTASIDVDEDAIENLIDREKAGEFVAELSEMGGEIALSLAFIDEYTDLFSVELAEEYENLSNGDKVKVIVKSELEELGYGLKDVEKELGIKFKDTEITYKVEGLVDAKTIDIFEGIEECITYVIPNYSEKTPISGESSAIINIPEDFERVVDGMYFVRGDSSHSLKVVYNNQRIDEIGFSIDGKKTKVSSGDKINVVITGGNGLQEYNYLIPYRTKEYTVPKLAERVESKSQLTADKISEIKSEAVQYMEKYFETSTIYELYCYEIKPSSDTNIKCGVAMIADYDSWFNDYVNLIICPIILPDGTWEYEISTAGYHRTLEDAKTRLFDNTNYTYEKI